MVYWVCKRESTAKEGLAPTPVVIEPTRHEGRRAMSVQVEGNPEPIIVLNDDVILPEWAKPLGPGIALDVQAILASR